MNRATEEVAAVAFFFFFLLCISKLSLKEITESWVLKHYDFAITLATSSFMVKIKSNHYYSMFALLRGLFFNSALIMRPAFYLASCLQRLLATVWDGFVNFFIVPKLVFSKTKV